MASCCAWRCVVCTAAAGSNAIELDDVRGDDLAGQAGYECLNERCPTTARAEPDRARSRDSGAPQHAHNHDPRNVVTASLIINDSGPVALADVSTRPQLQREELQARSEV